MFGRERIGMVFVFERRRESKGTEEMVRGEYGGGREM